MSLDLGSVLIHFKPIGADTLNKEIDRTSKNLSGLDKKGSGVVGMLGKMGAAVGGALAIGKLANFMGDTVKAASDLSESLGKSSVVFGEYSDEVEQFGDTAAKSMGMSKQKAIEAAGTFGNLMVTMGMTSQEASTMSMDMVTLAADLAALNNTGVDEAILAIRSGLTGESEPMKRFGVNVGEAALKSVALAEGLTKTAGPLDASTKLQAAYKAMLEQTTTAQGNFLDTSEGLAGQQKIITAQWADMKAELGQKLLPIAQKFARYIIDNMPTVVKALDKVVDVVVEIAEGFNAAVNNAEDFFTGNLKSARQAAETEERYLENFTKYWDPKLYEAIKKRMEITERQAEADENLGRGLQWLQDEMDGYAAATREAASAVKDVVVETVDFGDTIDDVYGRISKGAQTASGSIQDILIEQGKQVAAWGTYKDQALKLIETWKKVYSPEVLKQAVADPEILRTMMGGSEADVKAWLDNIAYFVNQDSGIVKGAIEQAFKVNTLPWAVRTASGFSGAVARELARYNATLSLNVKVNPIINWAALPPGISTYKAYAGGGVANRTGLAHLEEGERVLSPQQTQVFEKMVEALERLGGSSTSTYNMYTDQATMNAYSRQRSHALMGMG